MTWKWTRTVSPALNAGRSDRSCRCSSSSIGFVMARRPGQASQHASARLLTKADALRRPVDGEDRPDQVLARDGPPAARIARGGAVVAEHDVLVLRNGLLGERVRVAPLLLDVGLVELLPVDVDVAVLLAPAVAGQADQALDEGVAAVCSAAGQAGGLGRRGRLEDDDLASLRVAEVVDEAVRQHAVREAREAAGSRP